MKSAQELHDELNNLIKKHATSDEIENKAVELQARKMADEIDREVIELIAAEFRNMTIK